MASFASRKLAMKIKLKVEDRAFACHLQLRPYVYNEAPPQTDQRRLWNNATL